MDFPRRPLVMGIVNLGTDSFSGDGIPDTTDALSHARAMLESGADIIDVGAESARTNRPAVSEEEEIARLLPFIRGFAPMIKGLDLADPSPLLPPLLSINTWRPSVARAALEAGGDMLNDIGGLPTDENARICAGTGAALLIMHSMGEPKVAHTHIVQEDVVSDIREFFERKLDLAAKAGLEQDATILDPGIDFAKQRRANLQILRHLHALHAFQRPLLLPISRKTVIGEVLGISEPALRDPGTIACLTAGFLRGASIFRVHNVRAAVLAVRILTAVHGEQR